MGFESFRIIIASLSIANWFPLPIDVCLLVHTLLNNIQSCIFIFLFFTCLHIKNVLYAIVATLCFKIFFFNFLAKQLKLYTFQNSKVFSLVRRFLFIDIIFPSNLISPNHLLILDILNLWCNTNTSHILAGIISVLLDNCFLKIIFESYYLMFYKTKICLEIWNIFNVFLIFLNTLFKNIFYI